MAITKPQITIHNAETGQIVTRDMTAEEIVAYTAGYRDNEADGNFKDWGR